MNNFIVIWCKMRYIRYQLHSGAIPIEFFVYFEDPFATIRILYPSFLEKLGFVFKVR